MTKRILAGYNDNMVHFNGLSFRLSGDKEQTSA